MLPGGGCSGGIISAGSSGGHQRDQKRDHKVKSSDLEVGDRLPEITIGTEDQNTSGEVYIYETSDKYDIADAEWVTSESKDMTIGEEPKMKVWLSPGSDGDTDYYFRGSYGSSNVTVSGGTYSSASRDGDDLVVTLRIKPIKGTYGAPEEAYWADSGLGKARWKKSEEASSGAYEWFFTGETVR